MDTGSITRDDGGKRGTFVRTALARFFGFRDVLDGTSNTVAMGEICVGNGDNRLAKAHVRDISFNTPTPVITQPSSCLTVVDPNRPRFYPVDPAASRGRRWADGHATYTGFQTVLPPNSPSCRNSSNSYHGLFSAASHHNGGAHILMTDGAVRFITDSIDTNNLGLPSVSRTVSGAASVGAESPMAYGGRLELAEIRRSYH